MKPRRKQTFFPTALVALVVLTAGGAAAALPVSLDQVPVPEPANLGRFVKDRGAAVRLGKALFWDMQVGSDGQTACASCHFHAGTDNRTRNTVAPGPDGTFQVGGRPNAELRLADFPFHQFQDAENRASAVVRSRNDAVGAQGVPLTKLTGSTPGRGEESGRALRDSTFSRNGRNVRQVTGRNAPSVINAVFNFTNFLDGRANHFFNGVTPFGIMDTRARVYLNTGNGVAELDLTGNPSTNAFLLNNASLASQAVGPPLNEAEMSWRGRSWPLIGRKMLPLRPLARQKVHPADSHFRQAPGLIAAGTGLTGTYADMVRRAFRDEFWNGGRIDRFSQMEANFSLFFGLAVQLYEATLVSDDTPFDRHLRGVPGALTASQARGMNIFFGGGAGCANCHSGPELTAATVSQATDPAEPGIIEQMAMGDDALANYDIGFYNIGVRPTSEDRGRGGRVTLNGIDIPLSFTGQFFARGTLPFQIQGVPGCINNFLAEPPTVCPPPDVVTRQAVGGAFKTPGLRNVELTGPYFHNGGMATLRQVVDFYVRGGDFHEANLADLDPFIGTIGALQGDEARQADLINFLLALTDERVRWERAPFDHPQLFVPDGHSTRVEGNPKRSRVAADVRREIPAVGAAGRQGEGLPPLKPFLADNLSGEELSGFHFR